MAALSSFHFFEPRALSQRAPVGLPPRIWRRRASDFGEIVVRMLAAAGETVLFVWTVFVLAFWLLILVGLFL